MIASPSCTGGNYRSYAHDVVTRLRFTKRTRDLGFSLEEARALLGISSKEDRDYYKKIEALATEHLAYVDRKIADLTALRQQLSSMIASCRGGTVANCQILEAFQQD